jgi:hypothetical protein
LKTLMPMGVLFAIIFLISPVSMVLAQKENCTVKDKMMLAMPNNTLMSIPLDMLVIMPMKQNCLPKKATNVAINITPNVLINCTPKVVINVTNKITIQNMSMIVKISAPNAIQPPDVMGKNNFN